MVVTFSADLVLLLRRRYVGAVETIRLRGPAYRGHEAMSVRLRARATGVRDKGKGPDNGLACAFLTRTAARKESRSLPYHLPHAAPSKGIGALEQKEARAFS